MDLKSNQDDIDWSSMHNRILPKEKLISLEQFYNLTMIEKKNKIGSSCEFELDTAGPFACTNKSLNDPVLNPELSDTKTSNLRVDHYNFINNYQTKQSKVRKNLSQYQPSAKNRSKLSFKGTHSFQNKDDKKPVLQLQNHNLVFMNPSNSQSMGERKHNRSALKNKIFTLQPDSILDQESKLSRNPKLTFLKRYVANNSKNGPSQFYDGHWGNHAHGEMNTFNSSTTPGLESKFSEHNEKTPSNTFGNYIPYNPNQASFNPNYKERELSVIDLQLPIKSNNYSFAHSSQNKSRKSELNASEENILANSKLKSLNYKNSQSNSSILIENLDYSNVISRTNDTQNQANSAIQNNLIPEIDELVKFKTKDRSNTFLNKYLMSQQKKKQLSNSSNKLFEANFSLRKLAPFKSQTLIAGANVPNNVFSGTATNEIIINSSLNNISSNSLLIKRLNF